MQLVDYSDSESDVSSTENDIDSKKETKEESEALVPPDLRSSDSNNPNIDGLATSLAFARKRKAGTQQDGEKTRSRLPPPLPSSFHSLYATNVRTTISDDPSLHGGRKRQIPHVQGHWPSHVYLEWLPGSEAVTQLDSLVQHARAAIAIYEVTPFFRSFLGVQAPLHISLSAPLVLTTDRKDAFAQSLTTVLSASRIPSFGVRPESLDWVPNFDKSRHFLILRLSQLEGDELNRLLKMCNATCSEYDLPLLYEQDHAVGVVSTRKSGTSESTVNTVADRSRAFHISIAWMLEKPSDAAREAIRGIPLGQLVEEAINFREIKVKIGNTVQGIALNT